MSFGFGVGDFLAVIGLVTQLRKDFADAPSQLRDLSAELKTFSIVLQDTEVDLTASELDARQLEALESTLASARDFLKDLQRFIDKNKGVLGSTGSKARVKRIWKRLNFDQQEVSKFRLQISSIISSLQLFTSNEVKNNTRKIARYVDKQVHNEILKWLSDDDFNYHRNYQSHLVRNRQAGTRKWLLGSDEWKSWVKSGGQTLYCPGIPGSGKTFTTAMVIENMDSLSEEHGLVFAYVFCNYQQRKENMHEMLLRSLLRMVLEQTQQISDEIHRWPNRNKEISISEILEQLRISIRECSRVFLIVDALDELDMCHDFVSYLFDLQKAVGVNLYFTSRDIPHIRMLFDKTMIVPIRATEHDVGVYLDCQMKMPHVPNFVRSNQALQDEIKKTIVSAVGEMFLLAELQVKQLMQSKSTRRLQNALKAITFGTSTYETAYKAAMDRIQSQDKRLCELAKNAISILAYAERPLLAPELIHALSVDLDFNESSDPDFHEIGDLQSMSDILGVYDPDLEPTVEEVLAASAGLIVHQPDSGIVQLVHKTTKEYLMSDDGKQKWFPRAQFTIAAICLIYAQAFEGSDDTGDWPFLDYAQKHYGHHVMAQQSLERSGNPASIRPSPEFASDPNLSLPQAQQLMDQIGLARMAQELGRTEDILIVACEKNHLNLARVLLSTKQYSRSAGQSAERDAGSMFVKADCAIDRALLAAVQNGHLELVDLLLKNGASPMIQGEAEDYGLSLLAIASKKEHHSLVAYFLDHDYFTMAMMQHDDDGFPPDAAFPRVSHDFRSRSPICVAAFHGNLPCVKILLKWIGIDTNPEVRDAEKERILQNVTLSAMAGDHDHVQVLEILPLLNTTSVTTGILRDLGEPNFLFTSIRWTEHYRKGEWISNPETMVEFFLRNYTFDLSARDATGASVLTLAAKSRVGGIVYLILEQSEDLLNSQDCSGRTPLSWATQMSEDVVPILLGHKDIQAELVDAEGLAPIDHFVKEITPWTLSLLPSMIPLLDHGINRILQNGCTLLHVLIDTLYGSRHLIFDHIPEHWDKLELYEGRKIFEFRDNSWRWNSEEDDLSPLRHALGAVPMSAAQVRSSPCKCGISTIFLAISTEVVGIVEILLDFYPEFVNDTFFDGSSPLDLASCIQNQDRRQSMIDLILSKDPIVKTYKTVTPRSCIGESDSGKAQEDGSLADLEIRQRQGDHTGHETDDE